MTSPPWGRQPLRPPPGQPPWAQNPWNRAPGPGPWAPPGYAPVGPARRGNPYGAPAWGRPPRRRRNPLWGLLLVVGVVVLIGAGGLSAGNLSTPAADAPYQNEDYRVPAPEQAPPPIPTPETYQQAEEWLIRNPVYDQNTPQPVRCDARPVRVSDASDAELDRHFEELMECLVRVWEPPMTAAGWQIYRPTVTIYGNSINTRCGNAEVNAFYCAADQQVYFSNRLPDAVRIVRSERWAADVVMAHEFGHALQGRTGILVSSRALGQQAGSESAELELSRRTEVQADCLSGMSLRSLSESLGIASGDVGGIQETYNAVGDDVLTGNPNVVGNHGRGRNREYWGTTGLGTNQVGACNAFTAERNLVR